jgi:hypothetical protein
MDFHGVCGSVFYWKFRISSDLNEVMTLLKLKGLQNVAQINLISSPISAKYEL